MTITRCSVLFLAVCFALVGAHDAKAVLINYGDFSSTAGLSINGDAAQAGNRLRLTPDTGYQAGSAFLSSSLDWSGGFSTTFQFQITSNVNSSTLQISDGLAFVIHSDPRGAAALGETGGNKGYADGYGGGTQITPSVIIEFDTFQAAIGDDPNDSHIGLMLNGVHTSHVATALVSPKLDNGSIWTAQVNYDPVATQLDILLGENLTTPTLRISHTIDLATQTALGPQAYFGFTAGTGGGFANQDILSWQLSTVPEPTTLAIFGFGLAGLASLRRRRRVD